MTAFPSRSRRRALPLLLIVVTFGGCASAGGSSAGEDDAARGSADHILRTELADLEQLSAYQAIQRLRPGWLRERLGRTPVAVIDGQSRRSLRDLQTIRATEIADMRFLSAGDATTRYGTGYDGGAIIVTLLRR